MHKKINETIEVLGSLFDRAKHKRKVKAKHVKAVIKDLNERKSTIKERLKKEKRKSRLKQLNNELDVIQTQLKKGNALLRDLQKKE